MWFWPNRRHDATRRDKAADGKAQRPTGLAREVAGVASDLYEPLAGWLGVRPNRDPLLTRRTPGSDYAWPYGLFEEALDKDAHLSALVNQRKAALLGWERGVVPADASPEAAEVAAFVEDALNGIGTGDGPQATGCGFERGLAELLDAVPYGLAVSEVVWERRSGPGGVSALAPARLLSRHPRRFTFTADNELRLLTAAEPVTGEALPERRFLVFAPYGRHEDPYGLPQLRSVWWLAWFKRQVLRFWVMYCEKYGSPTAVLRHPLGATGREQAAYRRIVASLQQETGLVVPEGVGLEFLEATRSGGAECYRELVTFANAEMSKALLGQTLTTESGESGSYSLGRVHQAVREDIVRSDAQALAALLNGTLVRWIVDLNFPPEKRRYPAWRLSPPAADDLRLQLEVDRFFSEQGLALDPGELYARYGRGRPETEEVTADE